MKWLKIKRRHRLLIWTLFCVLGLVFNIISFSRYLGKNDPLGVLLRVFWIMAFGISAIVSFISLRKEIRRNETV